jgi:hypothetical protein
VRWQRKAHTTFEQAEDQQEIGEGERVNIASSAGYGQATTIRLFDNSTIDMWAGADMVLAKMQTSRWTNHMQQVVVKQKYGYIRYDLQDNQPYERVRFQVQAGEAMGTVELAPGGSYSIEIRPSERHILVSDQSPYKSTVIDIAVRTGRAVVQGREETITLTAGERLVINPVGALSSPMPATWELVRDGTFSQYSEEEYNNTTITDQPALPRSQTWKVYGVPSTSGGSGFFRISHGCTPPQTDTDCPSQEKQEAGWFIRGGNQTTSFTTGVLQHLGFEQQGIDISEYRSLVFSVWVRVLYQSLDLAGVQGTECPLMIRFVAKESSPADPEEERVICLYTSDDPAQEPVRAPGVVYYRIEPYEWFHLRIELRDDEWLPQARYLRSVWIYANGHDYDSRATGVSLMGSHYDRGFEDSLPTTGNR